MGSCQRIKDRIGIWIEDRRIREQVRQRSELEWIAKFEVVGSALGVIVVVVLFMLMSPRVAQAQSMHSTAALEQGRLASATYAGSTFWVTRDGFHRGSLVPMGFDSVRNKYWGLTAAHVGEFSGTYTIGTGDNWITNPGMTATVSSFVSHPLAVPGGFTGTEVDLAIVFWDNPLPFTPRNIGSAVLNEVLTYSGFGRPATPAGFLPVTGDRRAFQTRADEFGSAIGGISSDYVGGVFWRLSNPLSLPLGGVGTGGNSGSGVFNSSDSLVALVVAQSGAPSDNSTTYSLRLDRHQPWIYSIVPSPGAASLLLLGGLFAARRRRG